MVAPFRLSDGVETKNEVSDWLKPYNISLHWKLNYMLENCEYILNPVSGDWPD